MKEVGNVGREEEKEREGERCRETMHSGYTEREK